MKFLNTTQLFLVFCLSFISCQNKYNPNLVIVTIEIKNFKDIEKIILVSKNGNDSLLRPEINNLDYLECPMKGEGEIEICVFKNNNKICSEQLYVEGGYRPKLKFENDILIFINHF